MKTRSTSIVLTFVSLAAATVAWFGLSKAPARAQNNPPEAENRKAVSTLTDARGNIVIAYDNGLIAVMRPEGITAMQSDGSLANTGVDAARIDYRAAFGRPLDYYTGLVFEVTAEGSSAVLAGGGRFDRLMTLLGARDRIPAVGFALWLDRIEIARAA